MKITNEQLKQIIKEELESVLDEQNFDTETGRAITDRGRKIEKERLNQAITAEKKCFQWAKENHYDELRAAFKSGKYKDRLPPELLEQCPHKASDAAHHLHQKIRDAGDRVKQGLPPAEDDKSVLAKYRDRVYRQKHGMPPKEDDTSVMSKYRRKAHARKNK